jgi:drug/metabolite transporter (DMT)-like permease
MTGALWAALAGIGFGFFQAFNRRAKTGFTVYGATVILLTISAVILAIASIATEDLSILGNTPLLAYVNFGLAGFIHFFLGWTFINISQNKVGASRTGALVGATPLFATVVAILAFGEFLSFPVFVGIIIVVAGVYFVSFSRSARNNSKSVEWRVSIYGLGVAVCFSISPIFIRAGLEDLPSPLLGVTIGMAISAITYGILLLIRREPISEGAPPLDSISFQIAAGVLVGLSTWMRWIALDSAPVAVVLALGRLNVPVVILLSLILIGQETERISPKVVLGAALVVLGSLILIFF